MTTLSLCWHALLPTNLAVNPCRAVLSLDDDIMMPCSDVELGFALWRQHPDKIVGYYPRLITESSDGRLEYNWEDSTVAQVRGVQLTLDACLTGWWV